MKHFWVITCIKCGKIYKTKPISEKEYNALRYNHHSHGLCESCLKEYLEEKQKQKEIERKKKLIQRLYNQLTYAPMMQCRRIRRQIRQLSESIE